MAEHMSNLHEGEIQSTNPSRLFLFNRFFRNLSSWIKDMGFTKQSDAQFKEKGL